MTDAKKTGEEYDVLSPWAEADPRPLLPITPRFEGVEGRKIGLFINSKRAAALIAAAVETRLKERWPSAEMSEYRSTVPNVREIDSANKDKFAAWVKGVDAVVLAVGD